MSVWDRCISRGVPGSMLPAGYNNAYRILQTPGHVVIHHEMNPRCADHPAVRSAVRR